MEYLLINHPLDCPVCDQAGECFLQDYSFQHGLAESRFEHSKIKQNKKDIGKNIVLYSDRCIMCTRCVRFTREISGGAELFVQERGNESEIEIFPGRGINDKMAGNIVDICPVGAHLDKQFLFKQRVWFLKSTKSICPRCSRGCSIYLDHNKGAIWRVRPRFNSQVNGHWICDDGRYGFKFAQADQCLTSCKINRGDKQTDTSAQQACKKVVKLLKPYAKEDMQNRFAVVLSPAATCEDLEKLASWASNGEFKPVMVMGPVFKSEKDEVFKSGFTISSEKVPNRLAVEKILSDLDQQPMSFDELTQAVESGKIDALWIQGGYPWQNWCDPDTVSALEKAKVLIAQDILESNLTRSADVVIAQLPWAKKQGSYINDQGIRQNFDPAIEKNPDFIDDQQIFDLLKGSNKVKIT